MTSPASNGAEGARRPVAVIAGGSAGIGLASAIRFAEEGYDVAIFARHEERVMREAERLRQRGVRAMGHACDVGDAKAVEAAKDAVMAQFGRIDVWVNCAMLTVFGAFEDLEDDEFRKVMDTTFMGQVNGTRAALSVMRPAGRGAIVNVGSGLSYRPVPLQSAYCSAKHAINGFTSSVRSELIHDGFDHISLSLVQLPAVNTPQFSWARHKMERTPRPAPPAFQPEVAADAIFQAAREGSRELLVGRSVAGLVFGQMAVPNYLDHKMADAGYSGQKSDTPASGWRDGNLMEPVDGDWGAHGDFDDEAADSGMIVDADTMRYAVFAGGALFLLGAGMALGAAMRPREEHTIIAQTERQRRLARHI